MKSQHSRTPQYGSAPARSAGRGAGNARKLEQDSSGKKTFIVTYQKFNGTTKVYGRYAERAEADRVCGLLKWAGAVSAVEVDR